MKKVKSVTITNTEAVELSNELAILEERKVADSITRLVIKAARRKIAWLKKGK